MAGGPSGTHLALFDLNTLIVLSTPPYLRFLASPVASLVLCGLLLFPVCGQHSFVDPSNPLYVCMCRYSRSIDPILLRSASFSMCQLRAWWSPVSHPFVACPIRRPSLPTSWARRPACRPSWHPACSSTWRTSWVAGLCQEMVNSWGDKPAMPPHAAVAGPRGATADGTADGRSTDGRNLRVSPLPRGFWDQKGGPLCMGEKANSSNPPIKSFPPSGKRAG